MNHPELEKMHETAKCFHVEDSTQPVLGDGWTDVLMDDQGFTVSFAISADKKEASLMATKIIAFYGELTMARHPNMTPSMPDPEGLGKDIRGLDGEGLVEFKWMVVFGIATLLIVVTENEFPEKIIAPRPVVSCPAKDIE